jgi:hypothetical protein
MTWKLKFYDRLKLILKLELVGEWRPPILAPPGLGSEASSSRERYNVAHFGNR